MSTLTAQIELTPERVIRRARGLLRFPEHATTGRYAAVRDGVGEIQVGSVDVDDPRANCFCLYGALARAVGASEVIQVELGEEPEMVRVHFALTDAAYELALHEDHSNHTRVWDNLYDENPATALRWLKHAQTLATDPVRAQPIIAEDIPF